MSAMLSAVAVLVTGALGIEASSWPAAAGMWRVPTAYAWPDVTRMGCLLL
jgi:hypothetical protein